MRKDLGQAYTHTGCLLRTASCPMRVQCVSQCWEALYQGLPLFGEQANACARLTHDRQCSRNSNLSTTIMSQAVQD